MSEESVIPRRDGPALNVTYRQGTVLSWNSVTLENVVEVGGTPLTNVPVLGVAEADAFSPGDVVGLILAGSTWAIIGRLVIPGTTAATDATAALSRRTVAQ